MNHSSESQIKQVVRGHKPQRYLRRPRLGDQTEDPLPLALPRNLQPSANKGRRTASSASALRRRKVAAAADDDDEQPRTTVASSSENPIIVRYNVDHRKTLWLVISSCFFLVPAFYAYTLSLFYYCILSVTTTVASINHWRRAELGIRRNIDRVVAHVSFFVYFATGCYYIIPNGDHMELYGLSIPGCVCILTCFYLSNKLMELGSGRWIICHFLFHVFVALEQLLVLRNIPQKK